MKTTFQNLVSKMGQAKFSNTLRPFQAWRSGIVFFSYSQQSIHVKLLLAEIKVFHIYVSRFFQINPDFSMDFVSDFSFKKVAPTCMLLQTMNRNDTHDNPLQRPLQHSRLKN